MCGIFFSLSSTEAIQPSDDTCNVLRSRGPDSFRSHTVQLKDPRQNDKDSETGSSSLILTFISTVLSLRGDNVQSQPFIDPTSQSVFCWNGEAWKAFNEQIHNNDAQHIFRLLLEAVQPSASSSGHMHSFKSEDANKQSVERLTHIIGAISGPYSFVFYDGFNSKIYYGRDYLGRRSLLSGWDCMGNFEICSVCDGFSSNSFEEIITDGIHMIDVKNLQGESGVRNKLPNSNESRLITPDQIQTITWVNSDKYRSALFSQLVSIPLL